MKILVVDDSREDRDLVITHIKQSEGKKKIIIDESSCLTDAFKKININCYDVIILDLQLPETKGIETIKTMKKELEKTHKDIPIIILTGYDDYSIGRQAWTMGIKDFLCKENYEKADITRAIKFAKIKYQSLI